MFKKTLMTKRKIDFDYCDIPHGARFVGAPYQIQGEPTWYQKVEYPDLNPLPKPQLGVANDKDLYNRSSQG